MIEVVLISKTFSLQYSAKFDTIFIGNIVQFTLKFGLRQGSHYCTDEIIPEMLIHKITMFYFSRSGHKPVD